MPVIGNQLLPLALRVLMTPSIELPLHPSTVEALARYRDLRHRCVPVSAKMPFFVSTRGRLLGKPLSQRQVHRVFDELRRRLGWIDALLLPDRSAARDARPVLT